MAATDRSTTSIAATYAMLIAGALIATQVAGKATRDAFYLSNHDVSTLPVMLISAAVVSILGVFLWARAMTRWGPRRLMTAAFLGSAALLFAEWGMSGVAPGAASILVYFHMAALGALLVSGFWSLVNERFDPRTAKKQMGRIAGGATLGGLLGGLLAERVGATMSVSAMLPIMGVLHLGCALAGRRLEASAGREAAEAAGPVTDPGAEPDREDATRVAFTTLARVGYLRNLALLVVTMMAAAALIDYVFKVEATRAYTGGENLMRFFAIFYTAVAAITFVVQSTLSQRLLERLGLAQTVGTSPLIIAIGSVAAMIFPGLPTAAALRGTESTLQSSLYRSGYELLFTPIAPREKRATKSIIDVGFSRLGDVVGGGIVQLVLIFLPLVVSPTLLGLTIALSVAALLITRQLHRGYVRSLERSLKAQAVALDLDEVSDRTTRDTLIQSMTHLDLSQIQATAMLERPEVQVSPAGSHGGPGGAVATPAGTGTPARPTASPPVPHDPLVRQVAELRSGDPVRVIRALQETDLPVELAGHVIPLLAWDVVSRDAVKALRKIAPRIRGQLGDSLGDPRQEFAIRRRIPRVLAADPGQATAEVLMTALRDRRFEVRYRCGQALARVVGADPKIDISPERVYDAVLTETEVERRVWESRRLLDETDLEDLPPLLDEALEYRTNRSLEHVFTLLSIALPAEPLRIAYRGLLTDDQKLRGTSLEYLESVLPSRVRTILWPYLEGERAVSQAAGQPREEVLQKLMQSSESIVANLEELRRRTGESS